MNTPESQKGAVLLFSVLIIGLAAVAMMSALATSGLNSFVDSDQGVRAMEVRSKVFGCIDELLFQFSGNADYTTDTINTLDAACTVAIVNEGGDLRSADVSFTEGYITRSVHIEFSVNGMSLISVLDQ